VSRRAPDPSESADLGDGAAAKIRAGLPALRAAEARVARAILADPQAVIHLTVTELGEIAGSSTASVVRCCKNLGFMGFHHLKLALAQDAGSQPRDEPSLGAEPGDPAALMKQILAAGVRTLTEASGTLDVGAFSTAADALTGKGLLLFLGAGTSHAIAQDAAYRFSVIGYRTQGPRDMISDRLAARLLTSDDACIAVSHSGGTREIVKAVTEARQAGAVTIAVTSFSKSPLVEVADIALVAGGLELMFRLEPMSSRLAHLAILDGLYLAVASQQPGRANAALDVMAEIASDHTY
jgi:RpiR family transcriptional regulator, carbohydrate utilization regulator